MRCEEIMKRKVQCLTPKDTVHGAAKRMREMNTGFLPICDGAGRVLGTLTDRDITVRLVAENRPATEPVETIMSTEVIACRPNDDIRRAGELMGKHRKSRILVMDDGKLVGVISLSDIAHHDAKNAATAMGQVTMREVRA
ncbi:MAG: CBS domain-containing protein [Myxococcaceae bacterium]